MNWRREDREYDKMQEGFYVTGIERRIKKLEAENAKLREALEAIYEDDWVEGKKSHGPYIGQTLEDICLSALEEKE
jgi:hypothetical protein